MTVKELVERLFELFPRQVKQIEGWVPEFKSALNQHQGDALSSAYGKVMNGWTEATFPRPAEFAKHCRPMTMTDNEWGARWKHVQENLGGLIEQSVADAKERFAVLYGSELAERAARMDLPAECRRVCTIYLQRQAIAESKGDDRWMNGARWKLTDSELERIRASLRTREDFGKRRGPSLGYGDLRAKA